MQIEINEQTLRAAYDDLMKSYSISPQENTYGAIGLIVVDLRRNYNVNLSMPYER